MHIFIMDMMNSFGYIGIALLIMIENLFPPIPSEVSYIRRLYDNLYPFDSRWSCLFFHPRFHSWRHLSLLHWEITLSGKIRTTYRWKARKNPPFQKIRCQKIDQKIPTKREYDRFHLPLYPNPSKFNLYSCRNVEHENGQFFSPYNCRKCTLEHYSRLSRRCCRSLLGKNFGSDGYIFYRCHYHHRTFYVFCVSYYRNRKNES